MLSLNYPDLAEEIRVLFPTIAALEKLKVRRATAAERSGRWCRRNPVVASPSVTAAMLLLLVAVTASIGYARTSQALAGERT